MLGVRAQWADKGDEKTCRQGVEQMEWGDPEMTREEFMKFAEQEIDKAFQGQRNRMMNLVQQAWAEGKRNAETEQIAEIVKGAVAEIQKQIQPQTFPGWPYPNTPTVIYNTSTGDTP